VNHLPAIIYSLENGRNTVTERLPGKRKPIDEDRSSHPAAGCPTTHYFGRIKARYNSYERPLQNENTCARWALVASVGFLVLGVVLVFPIRRVWPSGRFRGRRVHRAVRNDGGFQFHFNLLVFDQIRSRIAISISSRSFACSRRVYPLDGFLLSRTGLARKLRYPAMAGLAILGIADQTPTPWFQRTRARLHGVDSRRFQADRRSSRPSKIRCPKAAKIFTCRVHPVPGGTPAQHMNTYEMRAATCHTNTLVWSYATMKNREVDVGKRARRTIALKDSRRIVVRGSTGIVDRQAAASRGRREIPNMGEHMVAQFKFVRRKHRPGIQAADRENDGRTMIFFDLRPYRDWLRRSGSIRFEQWAREERDFVALTWINGSNQ